MASSATRSPARATGPQGALGHLFAPLPDVTLDYGDLKDRMDAFTAQFNQYCQNKRDSLVREQEEFARSLASDRDEQQAIQRQISALEERKSEAIAAAERERAERDEAEHAILDFSQRKQAMNARQEKVRTQLAEAREKIHALQSQHARERDRVSAQLARNQPEIEFWQDHLAMTIHPCDIDVLTIVFTHIDDKDYSRAFSITVDLSNVDYAVTKCDPPLEAMPALVEKLNETRVFFTFLIQVRKAFKESMV